jgi:DNA-binding FadR family transcriptional regulator
MTPRGKAAPAVVDAPSATAFVLRAEERPPLSVLVSRQLRQAIVAGSVAAGTELPSEKDLGRDLGVGRSTVREAVRILQAQGLVSGGDTVSTRRPRVSNDQQLGAAAAQAMENVMLLGHVPLGDLVELRVVLEGAAVSAAASRPEAALEQAREALALMQSGALDLDVAGFRAADLAFHHALAIASGNAAFPLMMGVLRAAIAAHLGEALLEVRDVRAVTKRLAAEHAAIFEAVARRRPKRAEELVVSHVRCFYGDRYADRYGDRDVGRDAGRGTARR